MNELDGLCAYMWGVFCREPMTDWHTKHVCVSMPFHTGDHRCACEAELEQK